MASKPRLLENTSSASADTSFLPRSEFWRAPVIPHSFALVSFNGNEILRLANFSENVISAVRRALPPDDIRLYREDPELAVSEFLLAGKPFSGRSVRQEQLLLAIFSAIMSQNYAIVTSLDYGRIYLDKLTLAFSRALTLENVQQKPPRYEAFGLSFISTTVLRVVSPPLPLTPAILQVVRSSWPHGVVAEKRETDGSYTFKLKGYSFFKQSTFETDSLSQILELLRGMDSHGFALITSLCLTKRSRVQDFWIFRTPAPPLPPTPSGSALNAPRNATPFASTSNGRSSPVQSHSMLGAVSPETGSNPRQDTPRQNTPLNNQKTPLSGHSRSPSTPQQGGDPPRYSHTRNSSMPGSLHVLRKAPPPRTTKAFPTDIPAEAPAPASIPRDYEQGPSTTPRSNLNAFVPEYPSNSRQHPPYPMIHQDSEQLLYTSSPSKEPVYNTVPSAAFHLVQPPPLTNLPRHEPLDGPMLYGETPTLEPDLLTPRLLGENAFRDSVLSASTEGTPPAGSPGSTELTAELSQFALPEALSTLNTQSAIVRQHPDAPRSGVLGRSPKVVHPDLPVDDPSRRTSDQPLHGFVDAAVTELPTRGSRPHAAEPQLKGKEAEVPTRPTTKAAAAEVVSYSGRKPANVEVPMTVRVSDVGSRTGPWVLIHEPGTPPADGESPVQPFEAALDHDKDGSPLRVIPALRATASVGVPIPSDGDQAAYTRGRKPNFPWSRSRRDKDKNSGNTSDSRIQEETEDHAHDQAVSANVETGTSSPNSSSSSTPLPTPPKSTESPHSPHPRTPTSESSGFAKGVVGKFRRKNPIIEVGVSDKRLSIA